MKRTIMKIISIIAVIAMLFCAASCSQNDNETTTSGSAANLSKTEYKIGICNYVDDASLNQIVKNIEEQLSVISKANNVTFKIDSKNCMTDAAILDQIIANFIANDVDLMIGVATPVAIAMQAATEDNKIPVIFAAVSDPIDAKLCQSLEKPGGNITGTSDYLDTSAIMNLIFAQNPDTKLVGLLYDQGQDSSKTAIANAKEYLKSKNIAFVEHSGTTVDEVMLAADACVADKVDAIFTPTDNTIMKSYLSIYEKFTKAGIPHYTGADSFALNGAFLGYGVDYANLGIQTANMVKTILVDGASPAETPVLHFDNGTATINTDTCKALGLDYDKLAETFAPFCTKVQPIKTAEEFE